MALSTTSPKPGAPRSTKQFSPAQLSEYLAFKLGEESYGMDILCVQEIRSYEQPTRIANSPAFIKGVVNLRGVIVPIIDMRIKFGLSQVDYDHLTAVIVIDVGSQVLGVVVDGVSDVVSLTTEQMHPAPDLSISIISDHIQAIGAIQERMLILLDIHSLMTSSEMGLIQKPVH